MELRNVRAFLAVAAERHFGRAAASLNLTQPALTQRIQVLERELGIQLLQRSAREVRLTPAGEALLEHARAIVQEEDRTLREMKDHVAGLAGRLRISYLSLWDVGMPANIVGEFRRRYPAIKLETISGYSHVNISRLLAAEVDFAFIGAAIGEQQGITLRPLDRHEVVLVMPPSHHLAKMASIPIDCLRGEPMIAVSAGVNVPLAAAVGSWLIKYTGEQPNIVRDEPPDQLAAALAQMGNAVTLMTKHRAPIALAEGLVYRPLTPTPLIEYGMAYRSDTPSPTLANLLKTIEDITPPTPDLPAGSELIWSRPVHANTSAA
jgi:DNA-binding transcriptional LysR family regulator